MGKAKVTLLGGIIAAWALAAAAPASADQGDERQLRKSCERGDRSACIALGTLLAEPYSPSEDRPRAIALLRPVCDNPASVGEMAETCARVGEMLLVERTIDPDAIDPVMIDAYLARACDAGSRATCGTLAGELESGELIAPDTARARRLRERLCRAGEQESCDVLYPPPEPETYRRVIVIEDAGNADQDAGITYADLPPLDPVTQAEDASPNADAEASQDTPDWQVVGDGELVEVDPVSEPRFVGVNRGVSVPAGSANWVAMIWRPAARAGGQPVPLASRLACGGSLIAPGWVLTAAHCIDDAAGKVSQTSGHTIRLGAYNPFNLGEGNTHTITDVISHPRFLGRAQDRTLGWDIALIRYDVTPAARGRVRGRIAPVALDSLPPPQREIADGTRATVLGWGRTAADRSATSEALRKGNVFLQDRQSCTTDTGFTDIRRDSVFCAEEGQGQHNCQGDSGGPLVLDAEPGRKPVLIGVISGSARCGEGKSPSRFVRVTHHAVRAWLQKHLPADAWRRMTATNR